MTTAGPDAEPAAGGPLPAAVAQILDAAGVVAGAGFLIDADVLVTCAHVVSAAGSGPGGRLRLAFPHAPGAPHTAGEVLADAWRDPAGQDIAVVRLDTAPADVAIPVPGPAEGCRGHRVRSFGFPAQAPPGGHHGYAIAGDLLPSGGGEEQDGAAGGLLQLTDANDLTTGFSGAPVLDETTGLVIGMLTAITAPDAHLKGLGIAYATPVDALRQVWPALTVGDVRPYRELEPFTAEQAHWFHGRDDATEQVLAALAARRGAVLLLGPSGAGKSSLVQAGVLPALAAGRLPGSDRWLTLAVRPEHDLPAEIEKAGLPGAADGDIAAAAERRLAEEPRRERVVLVVDQFEELLTRPADPGQRQRQTAALRQLSAAIAAPAALSVVMVMRDDFYPRLAALAPDLLQAAAPGPLNIPATLSARDLRDIITLPARAVGAAFEDGLPERIITDVLAADPDHTERPGAPVTVLPLLELTLSRLWERRRDHGGYLTHQAYQAMGEVSGSITAWCDDAIRRLPAAQRPVAQRVLTALVRPADDTHHIPAVRQQVPLDTLRELAADTAADTPAETRARRVDEVIAALTRHRIVTTRTVRAPGGSEDAPGRPVAELVHDALIREWGTLRAWVAEDRRFQDWLRRAREQRSRWEHSARTDDLLRGTDLAEGLTWTAQRALPADTAAFLTRSRQAETKRRRVRRMGIALLTVLALLASGAAATAFVQRGKAVAQQRSATARLVASEASRLLNDQPGLAKQLALTAYRLDHGSGEGPLLAALAAPGVFDARDSVLDLAETRDGRTLLMATGSAIQAWSTEGHVPGRITGLVPGPLAVTPDGRLLAAAVRNAGQGSVRLWSLAQPSSPRPLGSLTAGTGAVTAVAISADGRLLAAGTASGAIDLWDVSTPQRPRPLPALAGHPGGVDSLAFDPARPVLASSGADSRIRLWNPAAPAGTRPLATVDGYHGPGDDPSADHRATHRIAFSPDGTRLAAPGDGKSSALRLWTVTDPSRPRLLAAPGTSMQTGPQTDACVQGGLRSASFSPDGQILATVCGQDTSGEVLLWQTPATPSDIVPVFHLPGVDRHHNGPAVFGPAGRVLLYATGNGVQQWDVGDPYQPGAVGSYGHVPDGFNIALAFSGGRRRLLAVVGGDSGELIDLTGGPPHRTVAELPGGYLGASAAAFSPDGTVLADSEHVTIDSGHERMLLRLRDTTRPHAPVLATVDGIAQGVHDLAFGPDGRILAVADANDDQGQQYTEPPAVKLFDVSRPAHPRRIATLPAEAFHLALSPDGRLLTADTADSLLSWDVGDPRHPVRLPTHHLTPGSSVSVAAFRPDGRRLVVGDSDGVIRLWQVTGDRITGDPTVIRIPGYSGDRPAFSPDGRTLLISSDGDIDTPIGPQDERPHLEMWDVGNPSVPVYQAGLAYQDSGGLGGNVAYSPDGILIATTISSSIDVWSTEPDKAAELLCESVGDVITPEQWSRYVPHQPYAPPCERPNASLGYDWTP